MTRESASDRFALERRVAAGAMGAVYKAWDRHDGVHVAIKLLHPENMRQAQRFEREAELLSTLSHPAIVRYVTHGTNPAGERFLVMEWLEGQTLEERLARRKLTASETVLLLQQVLEGCAVAHAAGIVHRDIKPANLLLVDGRIDRVKIADFGIARRLSDVQRLTLPGVVIGTPLYMSPEQARGDIVSDARSDVFSIGCVLFECLTGQPPFVGSSLMAILAKIILESPPSVRQLLPHLPHALEAVVERMLTKEGPARPEAASLISEFAVIQQALADAGESPPALGAPGAASIPSVQAVGKRGEQRVICVVLVGGQAPPEHAPTGGVAPPDAATVDAPPVGRMAPRRVLEALAPFGARLDQLLDGSMIITLSGSLTPIDQAVQAARCALTLRSLIPESPMALCTGRAVLGGQLPIGAVIDHGVRLLETSAIGMVRVDDATAGLLENRFFIAGRGERPELRHELVDEEAPRTLLGKLTPCLGRERDLEMLQRTFSDCIEDSTARAVLVTAPAGGGKSRVRHEFMARLRNGSPAFQLVSARADSMRSGSPYALLAPALRRLCGIENADAMEAKREKVRARVVRRLSPRDDDKATRIVEFAGELMGVPFVDHPGSALFAARQEPRLMADQILASWLDWLEAECDDGPVLVILEDLHWGDSPSVHLLDAALRALETRPLMVVGFAGDELDERFPALFRQRQLLAIRLGRLPRRTCEKLVHEALGDTVSAEKRAFIVERADGNAFYLEQLIIAMAAGGSESELPDTVLGMVQARVDGLGDQGKRVLRAASVFGQTFDEAGVRALLGGDRCVIPIEEWLPVLLKQEMVEPKGGAREGNLVFRSSLLRDAAYAMLTEQDRTLGHRLAAEWLESRGDTPPLVLAEHFERGNERARAIGLYRLSAEKALEANDILLVISCVDRAIACGAQGEVFGELMLLRADAHKCSGELREVETEAREALRCLAVGGAPWYRAAEALIAAAGPRGDTEAAETCAKAMLAKARGSELDAPQMIAMVLAASNVMMLDRRQLAEEMVACVHQQSGPATEPIGGHLRALEAQIAFVELGDLGAFLRHTRVALASFQLAGDLRRASWQQVNLGFALSELGQYAEAEAALEEAAAAGDRIGSVPFSASARQNLGLVQALRGSPEKGRTTLTVALDLFRPQGDLRQEGVCRMYLSRVLVLLRQLRSAESEAQKAVEVFANLPGYRIVALATLAHALLADRRTDEARRAAVAAMDLFASTNSVDEGESFVRLVHVRALQASGDVEGARLALEKAASRILERAQKISEQALRRSYLENVPENRATLELAAAWRDVARGPSRASG